MKQIRVVVMVFVWCLLLVPAEWVSAAGKTYTLGVVPQKRPAVIYEKWSPFAKKISLELGITIKVKPYGSMSEFEADIFRGVPDFVYMNPYQAMLVREAQGYIPMVRDRRGLSGIVVSKKGKGVDSVKDLNGQTLAFPGPNNFAASLYLRALLLEKEKIRITPKYVKTHSNVYRFVSLGKTPAGGGIRKTLAREPKGVQKKLNIIYETPATASHPLAAHPRVPNGLRKRMANLILDLGKNDANKKMLKNIQMANPIRTSYRKDYKPLKKLQQTLKKYGGE
ncbi:MAG TPA: phosphate ABC transporter [Nitrospiraceae bacterium]|nr:phosphate ABC transporter [Nitrospiraceae bacterium]